MADQEENSLRGCYRSAERQRQSLLRLPSSNAPEYQELLESCLSAYRKSGDIAQRASLFSTNESLEDIASNDIQYLLVDYYLADLTCRRTVGNRKASLELAQSSYLSFLQRLDAYEILDGVDAQMLERYRENPQAFTIVSGTDPTTKRETKIKRFRAEKELKQRLESLRRQTESDQDDEVARMLYLQEVALAVHETFQALESLNLEFHILSLAPPESTTVRDGTTTDERDRTRSGDGYSDRLDGPLSAGLTGPLLDAKGRPMRPFTLLGKRQEFQQGVFRPDHSLPTMSIDEYLEEERRRGGIIEGGGAQSGMPPEPDEDNVEKDDAATLKARAWDDFKDANPKGAGNTLNRG